MDERLLPGNVQGETSLGLEIAMRTDEFDQRMRECDPAGELSFRDRELLAVMTAESRPVRKHRYARSIGVIAVAGVVLGGTAAVAAASGLWEPWAQDDPYVTVPFHVPSGAQCEMRVGDLQGVPPEVEQVVRETLANATFTDADVVKAAKSVESAEDPLTDDATYEMGLNWAITKRVDAALAVRGLSWDGSSMSGQAICS